MRRAAATTCGAVLLVASLAIAIAIGPVAIGAPGSPGAPGGPTARPNILLVVSDDQAWSDFSRSLMPSVYSELVDQGVLLKRGYVDTPLCCPSRSQILTGLFERNTGVDSNTVPLDRPTIVQALEDLGYNTMLAGKYLNSWTSCEPRPEFDRWACVGSPPPATYSMLNPLVNEDGQWQQLNGYQTDILADQLVDFVDATPDGQPFFAMYSPTTPHMPADDPRYADMPVTPPRPASFDQDTMTGKSPLYARRGPLTDQEIAASDLRYTKMARSVRALDDGVRRLLDGLGERSKDTLIVYLSDNGFLFGEHRRFGKSDAYEESVNVPMVVRYPALLPANRSFTSQALVSNIDIAPTIAELAGIPWNADGRSLVPLLDGSARSVRSALLLEHCQGASEGTPPCSGLSFFAHQTRAAGYVAVVTSRYKLVRYVNGNRELFDLRGDPNELDNLVGAEGSASILASMSAQLARLLEPGVDTTIVTGPWPAGTGPSRVAAFTFFSPSRFSTYRCRLVRDGVVDPWHVCDGQSDVMGPLADGNYTFEVAGTDEHGNVDPTPASRRFTIASSGPAVSIGARPPAAQTSGDLAFSFSSPLAGASFECRLWVVGGPEASWTPCEAGAGASYTGLADGVWSFEVRVQDPATQAWSQPPAAWVVEVDRQGPGFAMAQSPPIVTSSREVALRFVPTETIRGPIRCRLDGRTSVGCSPGRFSAAGLTNGTHTVRISATDDLGNAGVTAFTWTIDVGPPKVRIRGRPDRFTTATVSPFRLWSKTDPALFLCSLDGGLQMPCDRKNDFGPMPDGPHRLRVWGLDAAMNVSDPITYRWTVDTIPPGLVLSGTPEDGATTADRTTDFQVWQSERGDLFCSLDGGEFLPCASPVAYPDLGDGLHTFEVYVRDRAGNLSIAASRSWTVVPGAPVP